MELSIVSKLKSFKITESLLIPPSNVVLFNYYN